MTIEFNLNHTNYVIHIFFFKIKNIYYDNILFVLQNLIYIK